MLNRFRLFLGPIAAAVLLALTSASAHAQRPALTKNVDEPGRTPYHQFLLGTCTSGTCRIAFKPVPAGFRLVVTHVSLICFSANLLAYLSDSPTFDGLAASDGSTNAIILPEAYKLPANTISTSSSVVTFFVEAGKSPNIVAVSTGAPSASINGYLVALD